MTNTNKRKTKRGGYGVKVSEVSPLPCRRGKLQAAFRPAGPQASTGLAASSSWVMGMVCSFGASRAFFGAFRTRTPSLLRDDVTVAGSTSCRRGGGGEKRKKKGIGVKSIRPTVLTTPNRVSVVSEKMATISLFTSRH